MPSRREVSHVGDLLAMLPGDHIVRYGRRPFGDVLGRSPGDVSFGDVTASSPGDQTVTSDKSGITFFLITRSL